MNSRSRTPRYAVGRLLDAYIEASGRTVEDVAEAAGVGRTNLYNWIAGNRPRGGDGYLLLRDELGIPQAELEEALTVERAERLRDAPAAQPNPGDGQSGLEAGLEARGRRATDTPSRGPRGKERS